jgi:putative two-component system response regulator
MFMIATNLTEYQLKHHAHICPGCGMDASAINLPKTAYDGRTYFFCSVHCQKVFEQNPDTCLSMQMERIHERSMEMHLVRKETLECLSRAAEFKDNETARHTERIGTYSHRLAMIAGLDSQHAARIRETAPLHDIGKIGIPESILLKPGKLDKDERKIIEKHPEMGAKILGTDLHSNTMKMASLIALTHHERWDGTGYPFGIQGENIPIEGRIVALCDVFDSLISVRPYKQAWPIDEVRSLVTAEQGKHFDPKLAQLFLQHFSDFVEIHARLQDNNCEELS